MFRKFRHFIDISVFCFVFKGIDWQQIILKLQKINVSEFVFIQTVHSS